MLQLCLHLCFCLGWFCSNPLDVSICWALVQLHNSFSAHIFLPEESQWGVLSKSKPGLGGTHRSDPRGSHTTTKSFRESVTLLCKRKDVKPPRAPIPAWRGVCAFREGQLLYVTPFLLVTGSSWTTTPLSSTKTSPGSLSFLFSNCPVFCSCSSLLLIFFTSTFITFCDPFSNFQP